MNKMSPVQRKVFAGCFIVYAGAYIARLNIAAALPAVMAHFSLTEAQGGIIQMLFALVYATGQLVNGALVDRISAKRHILMGLIGSALCNILFGLSTAYWQLLLFWALNGAAQSMLWTPVVKLLAGWFEPAQRKRASMWVSFSIIGGHFAAWAIAGYMAQLFSWRLSFILPAIVLLCFVGLAFWLIHDREDRLVTAASGDRNIPAMPLKTMLVDSGLGLLLICCAASGFVRDGVMTWGPTILGSLGNGASVSSTTISLVIPFINLIGVLVGQLCLRKTAGNTRRIIGMMMFAGAAVSLLLSFLSSGGLLVYALLLGACCAMMYGVNPLETVVLPMDYASFGRVGLAAGMIDSSVYLGAAITSVLGGYLKDALGLEAVFFSWAVAAVLGAVAALLSIRPAHAVLHAEE